MTEKQECLTCNSELDNGRCVDPTCPQYVDLKVFLERRVKELTKQALKECLRANKDELREQCRVTTTKQLADKMDGLETTDCWDDMNWHAGYIAGLEEAVSILTN